MRTWSSGYKSYPGVHSKVELATFLHKNEEVMRLEKRDPQIQILLRVAQQGRTCYFLAKKRGGDALEDCNHKSSDPSSDGFHRLTTI